MRWIKSFSNLFRISKMYKSFCNVSNKPLPPVLAICGATGTGKSKLAIELSILFNGEVINADAIQLHSGLDIATNKVLPEETGGVKHHLLGCLSANEAATFDIHKYRELCLPLVDQLRTQGTLPVLAGGTCYYLEAALWLDFLQSSRSTGKRLSGEGLESVPLPSSPSECYSLLQQLDGDTASHLHPRNTRKVRKALSELLHRANATGDCISLSGGTPRQVAGVNRPCVPRYSQEATLLLWLDCDLSVLDQCLDRRVDTMVQSGLIGELEAFVQRYSAEKQGPGLPEHRRSPTLDQLFTTPLATNGDNVEDNAFARRGILQAIGFKEFANYLAIPPAERETEEAQEVLRNAVLAVQSATRRYARRQRKWITNRFLRRPYRGSIPVYRLDVTRAVEESLSPTAAPRNHQNSGWTHDVLAPACRLVHNLIVPMTTTAMTTSAHLQSLLHLCPPEQCPSPLAISEPSPLARLGQFGREYECLACDRTLYGDLDWKAHLRSRRHQRRAARAGARDTSDLEQTAQSEH